jgi:hypothetical protein
LPMILKLSDYIGNLSKIIVHNRIDLLQCNQSLGLIHNLMDGFF